MKKEKNEKVEISSPTSNVSLLLERILNQLLKFVPAHLSNTRECREELQSLESLPSDCIVASLDVVSLYSNIPIEESIDAAIELLTVHRDEVDMFYLSLSDVRQLLLFVLKSNYFECNGSVFRQRKGLAMGNHLAPPLAIIFMGKLEEEALSLSPHKPRMYRRYIDDCILVWLHGLMLLMQFVQFLNSRHPDIRFTLEHTEQDDTHTISYLDLSISVRGGVIDWELFVKPSHSGVHMSYDSCLPLDVKRSVAREQFRRAHNNASTTEGEERGEKKIETILLNNAYPHSELAAAKQHQPRPRRRPHPQPSLIIRLLFISDRLSKDVRRTVRSYSRDVRVVFESGPSLRDMLVSSSSSRPECPREVYRRKKTRGRPVECRACDAGLRGGQCVRKGVVYSMFCFLCSAEYVGETQRSVRDRFQEHYRQARASTPDTPWGQHYATHHHDYTITPAFTPFHKASILAAEQSLVSRRIVEAVLIRERSPAVNSDCGWRLMDNG